MTEYRKIFVVGCPRSGTDWISKLIGEHPEVLSAGTESHAYPLVFEPFKYFYSRGLFERLRSPIRTISDHGWSYLLRGASEEAIWHQIVEAYERGVGDIVGLHHFVTLDELVNVVAQVKCLDDAMEARERAQEAITRVFDVFWRNNRSKETVFVEKTPLHIRYVPQIVSAFPESLVIEVVRDGRDVDVSRIALSSNPRFAWAIATTEEKIDLWIECVELGNMFLRDSDFSQRFLRVRYEDMRSEPNETIRKIFEFCCLEHTKTQLSAILQKHNINNLKCRGDGHYVRAGRVGQWKDELPRESVERWDLRAGVLLESLGYDSAR